MRTHAPVVSPGRDNQGVDCWVVFCDACSLEDMDYVYPCRIETSAGIDWPAKHLYEQVKP